MPSKRALDNLDQFVEAIRDNVTCAVSNRPPKFQCRLELTVDLEILDALVTSVKTARFSNRPASRLESFAALVINALGTGAKTLEISNLKEKPNEH